MLLGHIEHNVVANVGFKTGGGHLHRVGAGGEIGGQVAAVRIGLYHAGGAVYAILRDCDGRVRNQRTGRVIYRAAEGSCKFLRAQNYEGHQKQKNHQPAEGSKAHRA